MLLNPFLKILTILPHQHYISDAFNLEVICNKHLLKYNTTALNPFIKSLCMYFCIGYTILVLSHSHMW
jgi:hypothetical protein